MPAKYGQLEVVELMYKAKVKWGINVETLNRILFGQQPRPIDNMKYTLRLTALAA